MRFSTTFLLLFTLLQAWAAPQGKPGQSRQLPVPTTRLVQEAAPTLSVYPNPSRGQLTVQITGLAGQEYRLRLANILGREVRSLSLRPEQTNNGLAVDLSGLPAGLYFYSLLSNDKILMTKRLTLQGD
ncbi:MAG: T9SS type A sorting domain-containing protein [Hymenobacter sp.]|nr:MAG: T9SS type A sorting domain-containing protein [Hymenobacter sp.]